jgi:hypothetical protein
MGLEHVDWRGRSLVPEIFGEVPTPRPVLVDLPRSDLMDRRRALIDGSLKLISFGDDARFSLYDVVADPKEERPMKDEALLSRMNGLYEKAWAAVPNVPVVGAARLKGAPPGRGW